jgi:hypothetical protein
VSELTLDSPVSERPIREAFKVAAEEAGLKPIKMYNLRHSFGTTLARNGVDIRTIQALMRHDRLSTTEQYMAYSPRPDLAERIARALDPQGAPEYVSPTVLMARAEDPSRFLERLEEEIPAKWLREVRRVYFDAMAQAGRRRSARRVYPSLILGQQALGKLYRLGPPFLLALHWLA